MAANEKDALSQYLSEEELKEQIYKYLIYFITAHEYGHILNGDCDGINPEHANKELLATQQAKRLIKCLMPFEDEYHDGILLGIVPHKQICINNILPKYVSAIVEKLQNEATLM